MLSPGVGRRPATDDVDDMTGSAVDHPAGPSCEPVHPEQIDLHGATDRAGS